MISSRFWLAHYMEKPTGQNLLNLLRKGYAIPPLSPVAMRLVELAADDNCSAGDLANLIEKDPSLSVRLLKLANSAFFRTLYPVTTLNQAVVKVGFHHLRVMALSVSLRDTFPMGKVGALDYEEFWRISIYRALLARYLARELKTCSSEEAFVAALIMEIGLLVFFDLFTKETPEKMEIRLNPLEDLLNWEEEKYGVNHRQIGEAALRYWKFPDHMILCQQASGNTLSSGESDPLVRVCELARVLSQMISPNSEAFSTPYELAEKYFGLDQSVINDILLTTFEQVEDIADSLKVDLNKEKDILRIVEKANRTLSRMSEQISESRHDSAPDSLPALDSLENRQESTLNTLQAVAHEIRNPLTVIGGFARRLVASTDLDSAGSKYAHIILEEAARLEEFLSKVTYKTETALE